MKSKYFRIISAIALFAGGVMQIPRSAAAKTPIDEALFTYYTFSSAPVNVTWITCGSTDNTSGCYGAGTLGPFGNLGSMLEGYPKTNVATGTVSRDIYVVDAAAGSSGKEVMLNIYKKTDVITPDSDTVTVTFTQAIPLALVGGPTTKAFMAANKGFLFVGTSRGPGFAEIDKRTLAVTPISVFSTNITSITADQYGYVTVVAAFEFSVLGPDGGGQLGGGGTGFMLNPIQGVPAAFPPSE